MDTRIMSSTALVALLGLSACSYKSFMSKDEAKMVDLLLAGFDENARKDIVLGTTKKHEVFALLCAEPFTTVQLDESTLQSKDYGSTRPVDWELGRVTGAASICLWMGDNNFLLVSFDSTETAIYYEYVDYTDHYLDARLDVQWAGLYPGMTTSQVRERIGEFSFTSDLGLTVLAGGKKLTIRIGEGILVFDENRILQSWTYKGERNGPHESIIDLQRELDSLVERRGPVQSYGETPPAPVRPDDEH